MANKKISELNTNSSPSTSATLVGVDNGETVQIPITKIATIESTGDTTDRLAEIQAILDETGYLKLGAGEFYLSGQLQIKNGATLDGCGKATVIKQTPDSTQSSMIYLQSMGTIRNVCLQGEWTTTPTNETAKSSTRIGIVITNGTNNAIIDGCWIWGWTGQGILASSNSVATRSFLMSNCDVCYNNIGLKTAESEYACIANCLFRNNITGVLNNGGNNKFVSCGFDSNYDGFVINEGYNNGHGSCNGCTFNHNTHYAVNMAYTELGFVFSGCNFAEGVIRNTQSKGIMFSGCRFGNWLKYNNYTANPTLFSGCIFSHSPKTESDEWLDSYGGYKFINCMNYLTGEILNDDNKPIDATSTDGVAYTATVDGLTELYVGLTLTIIPDVAGTSASPTLNINSLGAKMMKRRNTTRSDDWYTFASANWLKQGYPIQVMWGGTYWFVESMPQTLASDLKGRVPIVNGGIPSCTTSDNGKVLKVVNGVPTWTTE